MTDHELIALAHEARKNAYAPYSEFYVGAAILAEGGKLFTGCNVENASFGLTVCAERNAVAQMVASGCRKPSAIAIVGGASSLFEKKFCFPCGACRQVLWEFNPEMKIILESKEGIQIFNLKELLPFGFGGDSL